MTRITTPFTAQSTAAEVLAGVDLTGRRMIVTGGASGLGAAAARALADAGAEVTITTREQMDLSDPASVRAFTDAWRGPVHAVVANAGVMAVPTKTLTPYGWELQLATNFLGHFALITGLRDRLMQGSRVVLVSSGAQLGSPVHFDDPHFERRPYDPWAAYAQSKRADVLLAVAIARRWAARGVIANAMNPGWIHTRLQRHVDADTRRAWAAVPERFTTPEQGAATEVLLAASPLLDGVTGRYFDDDNQEADCAMDPAAADRLWDYADAAVRGALSGPSLPERSSPLRQ